MAAALPAGIDCDVHPAVPGMAALLPYLDPYWREQVAIRGIDGMDLASFPTMMDAHGRPDWRPAKGKPGASLDLLRQHALDGFGSRIAICNPLYGVEAIYNDHFAIAVARAMNDWLAAEWLDREPRLRGSIIIPAQCPADAAAEIDRVAADPRFVQVLLLAQGDAPLGRRQFWPIYEAAAKHGLSIGIHAGSAFRHAVTSNGWPSYHLEDYAAHAQAFQSNLLSLVHEGVFAKFPSLTVVLLESGFTWLPTFIWRANKTWRGVRAEVPWVDRPPGAIIRDHVRLTLQPSDAPPSGTDMERLLAMLGSDDMLLFSTDYPHWQFDGDNVWPDGFSDALKRRVLLDNPRNAYPRLKELVA
jgi:predicted TIM-barrel fold metal-dependent hydrolase